MSGNFAQSPIVMRFIVSGLGVSRVTIRKLKINIMLAIFGLGNYLEFCSLDIM